MAKKGKGNNSNKSNKNKVNKFAPGKMKELLDWKKRPFLDKMLDDGISANQCAKWCNENGMKISVPTMYQYAKKRREALANAVIMGAATGKDDIGSQKPKEDESDRSEHMELMREAAKRAKARMKKEQDLEELRRIAAEADVEGKRRVRHDLELLDEIIQKGFEALQKIPVVSPTLAVKALEVKAKITEGNHGGLTIYGMEEIRLREKARETMMERILLEYIPEEQHEEVLERMASTTREFYRSIGLGEAYEQMEAMEAMSE